MRREQAIWIFLFISNTSSALITFRTLRATGRTTKGGTFLRARSSQNSLPLLMVVQDLEDEYEALLPVEDPEDEQQRLDTAAAWLPIVVQQGPILLAIFLWNVVVPTVFVPALVIGLLSALLLVYAPDDGEDG